MTERYDAIRAAHPTLAISLYGLTPGSVTLEIIAPDGFRRLYRGLTATECFDTAFPPEPLIDPSPDVDIVSADDLFA